MRDSVTEEFDALALPVVTVLISTAPMAAADDDAMIKNAHDLRATRSLSRTFGRSASNDYVRVGRVLRAFSRAATKARTMRAFCTSGRNSR
jgi:hypothetical protein